VLEESEDLSLILLGNLAMSLQETDGAFESLLVVVDVYASPFTTATIRVPFFAFKARNRRKRKLESEVWCGGGESAIQRLNPCTFALASSEQLYNMRW